KVVKSSTIEFLGTFAILFVHHELCLSVPRQLRLKQRYPDQYPEMFDWPPSASLSSCTAGFPSFPLRFICTYDIVQKQQSLDQSEVCLVKPYLTSLVWTCWR